MYFGGTMYTSCFRAERRFAMEWMCRRFFQIASNCSKSMMRIEASQSPVLESHELSICGHLGGYHRHWATRPSGSQIKRWPRYHTQEPTGDENVREGDDTYPDLRSGREEEKVGIGKVFVLGTAGEMWGNRVLRRVKWRDSCIGKARRASGGKKQVLEGCTECTWLCAAHLTQMEGFGGFTRLSCDSKGIPAGCQTPGWACKIAFGSTEQGRAYETSGARSIRLCRAAKLSTSKEREFSKHPTHRRRWNDQPRWVTCTASRTFLSAWARRRRPWSRAWLDANTVTQVQLVRPHHTLPNREYRASFYAPFRSPSSWMSCCSTPIPPSS